MKNVWSLGLVCLLLVSCGSGGKEKSGSEDRVCACATCIAIERNTREVLEKEFAFGNARKSPDTFKAGLVKTVSGMLK